MAVTSSEVGVLLNKKEDVHDTGNYRRSLPAVRSLQAAHLSDSD